MHVAAAVAVYVLWAFFALVCIRFIVDWIMVLARSWRPSGVSAAVLEVAYSATDPPVRLLRRLIPPLRLGSFALDLGFILLFIVPLALISILTPYAS